jgi:hypothetical protein
MSAINKHGESNSSTGARTPEYVAWKGINQRCYNIKSPQYKNYGGRGIKVCDRWKNDFNNFLEDMDRRPTEKHSIDRINVHGDYEPTNCKWSDITEQNRNKRTCIINKIVKKDLNGDVIKIYDSLNDVVLEYPNQRRNILQVCKNNKHRKTALGFIWDFLEDDIIRKDDI